MYFPSSVNRSYYVLDRAKIINSCNFRKAPCWIALAKASASTKEEVEKWLLKQPLYQISTIGTSVTVVGFPISASLAIVSTVSTCVGACLLLTSKKYKKELLKCYELLDKITSLATFETLISLSIDDDSVIDAKEFHKLQTLYLQLMTHVRNVDRKMKVQNRRKLSKDYYG